MFTKLFTLLAVVYAEGYYCPYEDLGANGNNDMLYDYYSQQGNVYIRLGQTGWEPKSNYCSAKGDLSIHSDAGQWKCEDSQGACVWTGNSCVFNVNRQPDCRKLCETIVNGGGLYCLGSDCPGGGDRNMIYAICNDAATKKSNKECGM